MGEDEDANDACHTRRIFATCDGDAEIGCQLSGCHQTMGQMGTTYHKKTGD